MNSHTTTPRNRPASGPLQKGMFTFDAYNIPNPVFLTPMSVSQSQGIAVNPLRLSNAEQISGFDYTSKKEDIGMKTHLAHAQIENVLEIIKCANLISITAKQCLDDQYNTPVEWIRNMLINCTKIQMILQNLTDKKDTSTFLKSNSVNNLPILAPTSLQRKRNPVILKPNQTNQILIEEDSPSLSPSSPTVVSGVVSRPPTQNKKNNPKYQIGGPTIFTHQLSHEMSQGLRLKPTLKNSHSVLYTKKSMKEDMKETLSLIPILSTTTILDPDDTSSGSSKPSRLSESYQSDTITKISDVTVPVVEARSNNSLTLSSHPIRSTMQKKRPASESTGSNLKKMSEVIKRLDDREDELEEEERSSFARSLESLSNVAERVRVSEMQPFKKRRRENENL
eukprot:TRINITY_DN23876_c0_g1_i1.p1 TRINITY_DN23876_c0_g1~~TRINITY_DN23876_c0_g1_i1.p1  ORF type:complete len:394 (-),score=49.30 TRINITY_DN23876_c0_g1_i1:86-1267(-)